MCFSAGASFTGGVIISAIGVATIRKIHNPSRILFAGIPLFFGLQQVAEGFVWLTLNISGYEAILHISTYIFLIMAQVIWPVLIPLSVYYMEESREKKKILAAFLIFGGSLSVYYGYCLLTCNVFPQIRSFHILYINNFPDTLSVPAFVVYLISSIGPLFVSSIKRTHLMGILMTFSCLVTGVFFTQFLVSVWCFFAALISGVIYWILSEEHTLFKLERLRLLKANDRR